MGVGFTQWHWGKSRFEFKDEGFFAEDTKFGGADKCGHFYSSYLISELFTKSIMKKGWELKRASKYAAWSSFALTTLIEIGDGTSPRHGFSYEDEIVNTLGVLTSYMIINHPSIDKKIDIRIEYIPTQNPFGVNGRLFDDYEGMKYVVALKLNGFEKLDNTFLGLFELQCGYKTRGYVKKNELKERIYSVGIGFNVNELLKMLTNNHLSPYIKGFFEYYQPPNTYIEYKNNLYQHNNFE
ncbi:MAG: DUF2279 domain-containing protein [Desulfobacterales bacterium]|nr:DUF2279 domain-containing protein [Desulfobacterales bacterium]